ncbi:MAG: 50S ribosomal protein L3 [SAR202 cluster bacterium]|jgi:large subunit ribosomal protein L3|nr:50S ribosomal protein L3 [SAR202 cluster bacterium]
MNIKGLIGKKIGMTQVFRETGEAVSVTAIEAGPCTVTWVKTVARDGYDSVQLGFEEVRKLDRPKSGHLNNDNGKGRSNRAEKLFRYLREFDADDVAEIEIGHQVDASMFESGEIVEAVGFSKGRGFAGGVKRHHFKGGPKTHGQSDRHRAPGSIGAGSTPGRVLKGMKMAGHMGNARVTSQGLEVMSSDSQNNIVLVRGSIPGARNSLVLIQKTGKAN